MALADAKSMLRRLGGRHYRTLNRIELSRAAMLHNLTLVQKQHPSFTIIPVLKGNAYGHGLEQVTRMLAKAPVSMLAVDGYFEANIVSRSCRHRLLVMGYILPSNVHLLNTRRCSFVVQDIAGLEAFGALNRPVRIHLEINTGMNRLGLQPGELASYLKVLKRYPKLELEGVMSHLVDADNATSDAFDEQQTASFDIQVEQVLAVGFRPKYVHLAQTAGSPKITSRYANAIRLGTGLYGINPLESSDPHFANLSGLQPVLELTSTIMKTLDLQPGDKVSYNGTFTATKPLRAGVLPLGYYEGVPRALSGVGCVTSGARVLPILGRVCMNHTIISLEGTKLGVGDEVTVISADPEQPNSVAGLQHHHNLFPYVTLTGLSPSVRRVIV